MNERARLVVRRSAGLVTVQDLGRPGFMHLGIPPGGALAPSRALATNAAVGNDANAALIEVVGVLEVAAEAGVVTIALDGEAPRTLARGEVTTVSADRERRVRYLAARGGIDVPIAFGGKGTLLVASLGGYEGRVLRRDDRLAIATARTAVPAPAPARTIVSAPLRVVAGPDTSAFDPDALATLLGGAFTVSRETDRVGTRLDGPRIVPLAQPRRKSAPMIRGGIQVPPDGRLIVLGPDHPTTGGYPLLAILTHDDVEHAVASPIGSALTFRRLS